MNGFNVARHQLSHHKYALFWFEIACLQSTQIAKLLWPKSSNFGTFIQPTYRMEWWHLGGQLLLPRSGPQASCMSTKKKTDKPKLAHIQNTHTWEQRIFTKKGPHLIWDIWAILAILHVGHFRLTYILSGPGEGQQCHITAWNGPLPYAILTQSLKERKHFHPLVYLINLIQDSNNNSKAKRW